MTREEAIQEMREKLPWLTEDTKRLVQVLIPELAESEDERNWKKVEQAIRGFFKFTDADELLAWLEKQKEPIPIPDKFSGLKSLLLQYLQSAANRKDDAEIEDDTDLWGRKILDYVWKQEEEQKPASAEDMPYITDEHFYEREPADSFKYKLAEYMTKCCTKKEGPHGYTYGISAETILKMAEDELLKRGVVQKPAEYVNVKITDGYPIVSSDKIVEDSAHCGPGVTVSGEKPAETQDYSGLTDLEQAIHRGFLCAGVENVSREIIEETAKEALKYARGLVKDELAKKHLDGYCMGREDTLREMKDFVESHFNHKEYSSPECGTTAGHTQIVIPDNWPPKMPDLPTQTTTNSGISSLKAKG